MIVKKLKKWMLIIVLGLIPYQMFGWPGMPLPPLHVEGRQLKDPCGNNVLLHGVAITPSPWFNGCQYGFDSEYCTWDNYDVQGCLDYNTAVMDRLTNTSDGWHLNYIRLHIDPYWTNDPGDPIPENDISRFNYDRLVTYTDEVIMPLVNHARERGMYVILRPPGVCPDRIAVGDEYHQYLTTVWDFLSQHPGLRNADHVMFELANEPIEILGTNGVWGTTSQAHFDALNNFFQPIVDMIRNNGAGNICWIPGTGWQSHYQGYANNPITGGNIGYAVHLYPGYWGGIRNYQAFQNGWDQNVKPIADMAPIVVTETDWAPEQYGTFGVATTGTAGGDGFGANLNHITNQSGNVSWNVLAPDNLLDHGDPNGGTAYDNDWEACAAPVKHWFSEYAGSNLPEENCDDGGNGTGNISVTARGVQGTEQIQVILNGSVAGTFTLSTSYQDYAVNGSGTLRVEFTNDQGDRDVQVDYATIDGTTYQAEDQSTNTGVWQDGSCGGSNSEWIHCNGYIEFAANNNGGSELVHNGVYEIEFQSDPNIVLDLQNGEDANGAVLRPWARNGATAQQWVAIDAGDGYWQFVSNASSSDRCIDLENGSTEMGTSIRLWDNYNNDAQAWAVTDAGNGYYKIVSKLDTDRGWDIPNCNMDGSESLQLWDHYGTDCQLFRFNFITQKSTSPAMSKTDNRPSIDVYPNPSDGNFTIDLSVSEQAYFDLVILSTDGKKVFEQNNLQPAAHDITTGLNKGVYIIKIMNKDNVDVSIRKLVVQ